MSSEKKKTVLFLNYMPFIPFSCLITGARTSSTMLNKSSEGRHSCLFPILRKNSFLPLSLVLALGF